VSDPFSVPHNRRSSKRLKINGNVKNNGDQILQYGKRTCYAKFGWLDLDAGVVIEVVFDLPPLGTLHFVRYRKWIRNGCV
ncbi:MAG: hypothetical protein V4488_22890, partial [Pseudomonadota bacterium]